MQVQLFLNPSGHSGLAPVHFLFVCLFTSFGGSGVCRNDSNVNLFCQLLGKGLNLRAPLSEQS